MGRMIRIVIILAFMFSFIGFYYTYERSKKQFESFEKLRSSGEVTTTVNEEIQYVDDCEQALIDSGRDYVICSLADGKMYLTNDKRVFKPGEYLGLQVNLQKLNEYYDEYYVCTHSNFPNYPTALPEEYRGSTIFLDQEFEEGLEEESWVCSKLFYQKDYHHVGFSGYAADRPGKYVFTEIFLFPELGYGTREEFFSNLDKAVMVFNISGEIR